MSRSLSVEPFFDYLQTWLHEHRLADAPAGSYVRQTLDETKRRVDTYSSADVANICYTIGILPLDPTARREWVQVMQSFQDPETGLYSDPSHHTDHTTAYAIAALDLFDARPLHPLNAYDKLKPRVALEAFLDTLDWRGSPWQVGHRGAGVASSLAITREAGKEWFDAYFDWLDREHDPSTGYLRKGVANERVPSHHPDDIAHLLPAMAGTFHFHFVYHHFRRPFPYPEAMIDSALKLQLDDGTFHSPGSFGFPELDAAFCLGRAARQCGHRFGEVMQALEKLAKSAAEWVNDPQWIERMSERLDDTHWMAGVVFCLAELQTLIPGLIDSPYPMKNVLDRRPFV